MRREERAIRRPEGIMDVLSRCDTIRIGIADEGVAYIVPVSFGCEWTNGRIAVYFHGAKEGRKAELLKTLPRVCVEADLCHGFPYIEKSGYTCDYESVIGWGNVELLTGREAERGVRLLLAHCGVKEEGCPQGTMPVTAVYRVVLDEVTGKHRNLNGSDR